MGNKPQPASGSQEAIGIPITVLKADPKNPRKIDEEAKAGLAVSLETFGPLDITFNERTGELVSGHQRIAALKAAGAIKVERKAGENFGWIEHPKTGEKFPVRFVDWDETKQRMGNLVANNPHLQGQFDEQAVDQVRSLEKEASFLALGLKKLQEDEERKLLLSVQMRAGLDAPSDTIDKNKEWEGMPEFQNQNLMGCRKIIVHFKTEEDVAEFARRCDFKITTSTKFVWFPEVEELRCADKAYVSEQTEEEGAEEDQQ